MLSTCLQPEPLDEARLEHDAAYRFGYLASFIGLSERERALVRAARPALRDRLDHIVAQISTAMLARPAMLRHFGLDEDGPPQAQILEHHLRAWIAGLIAQAREPGLATWMDKVGSMHRATAGDPRVDVPRVQMNALLGLLSDLILAEIQILPMPAAQRFEIARAFSKLLWIQNDLIQRHY
jgi:hypothetical protein